MLHCSKISLMKSEQRFPIAYVEIQRIYLRAHRVRIQSLNPAGTL